MLRPPFEELDDTVRAVVDETRFSGVVRVDTGGHTAEWAFGLADRRHDIPNRPTTRFGIASGTKGFTALVVMGLVELGQLTLDTPARRHLGDDLPLVDDAVTVEHLLAHRSGIGDYLDESQHTHIDTHALRVPVHELWSTPQYLPVLDGFPQSFPPGERFAYNNSGYVVLALIAERAAATPFDDLVRELVCRPAHLTHTGFEPSDALPPDVAHGYLAADGLRHNVFHVPVVGSGDGGLSSTVGDVRRFWLALFAGEIVSADTVVAMTRPRSDVPEEGMRYGLGFWLDAIGPEVILEGHDAGVSFKSVHDPTTDATVTVIANTSAGAWPMANALLNG